MPDEQEWGWRDALRAPPSTVRRGKPEEKENAPGTAMAAGG